MCAQETLQTDESVDSGPSQETKRAWWQPASFRELGGLLLSIALVVVLVILALQTAAKIGAKPIVYSLNDSELAIDPFEQAKDLLSMLFPLFGAVITFWLGAAVEGKRADENKRQAEEEKTGREEAEQEKERVVTDATAALAQVEGMVRTLPSAVTSGVAALQGLESQADPRQRILDALREAQQSLRR